MKQVSQPATAASSGEGAGLKVAGKSARPEGKSIWRGARIVLIGKVEAESLSEESRLEIHRCEDVRQLARFLEGAERSVLLFDPERLSEVEEAHLRKQMAQFSTVLALAMADSVDDEACESLLRMGCAGSLRRGEAPATILRALEAVSAGELWFPRATLSRVLREFLVARDPNRLTSREMEVLDLVGNGLNSQQIAEKLFIARETVRWHIKGLHAKLGTRTRGDLRNHSRLLNRLAKAIPAERYVSKRLRRTG